MESEQIVNFILGIIGFILTVAITFGIIALLRKPLAKALEYLYEDKTVSKYASLVILALLGFVGLGSALQAFSPDDYGVTLFIGNSFQFGELLSYMTDGLINLFDGFIEVMRWSIYIGVLLFIGFAIRKKVEKQA
ncbi:MAG: hypothetical protein JW726_05305 [Anaerolineales bacterium]|nr:hypothetical protein [Anaerolineales bacterium]